jgi:hypothetical protein
VMAADRLIQCSVLAFLKQHGVKKMPRRSCGTLMSSLLKPVFVPSALDVSCQGHYAHTCFGRFKYQRRDILRTALIFVSHKFL